MKLFVILFLLKLYARINIFKYVLVFLTNGTCMFWKDVNSIIQGE